MKIGVVGLGMVGTAVADAFRDRIGVELSSHDIKFEDSRMDAVRDTDVCFVCVSAPTRRDGSVNIDNILTVCDELAACDYKGEVVIKCTVTPGTMDIIAGMYQMKLVHNPEFLRERNASRDFMSQDFVLLSGDHVFKTIEAYKMILPDVEYKISTNYCDTELAKYIHNIFLAMKVTFLNEIYQYQKESGLYQDFHRAINMAASQGGLGDTHLQVPGPDGKFGFGGACFIKDTIAFYAHALDNGYDLELLDKTTELNREFRPTAYSGVEKVGIV
jgi:UDPglucose 6-dehydrogenase